MSRASEFNDSLHHKVRAPAATGAFTVLIVFIAYQFGLNIPPDVAAALTVAITFFTGYKVKG